MPCNSSVPSERDFSGIPNFFPLSNVTLFFKKSYYSYKVGFIYLKVGVFLMVNIVASHTSTSEITSEKLSSRNKKKTPGINYYC